MTLRAVVKGVGHYLPDRVVPNAELEALVETSDEWIKSRSGIERRHFAADGQTTSDLGTRAALAALTNAGLTADDIDAIIVATSTADLTFPSAATMIQGALGMTRGFAFDVQAVCAGFVFALTTANALIMAGSATRILVIGAETFSRLMDWNDRTTCVLFGDGAGALVLEAVQGDGTTADRGILATDLHADGKHVGILCVPGQVSGGKVIGRPLLTMDGQAVFKLAVGVLEDSAKAVLAKAGKQTSDLDWLVPHQANIRIMQSTAKRLRLPMDRVMVTVDQHGNTSAASIPLALDAGVRDSRIRPGQLVLLEGVGGGFTWGSVLLTL